MIFWRKYKKIHTEMERNWFFGCWWAMRMYSCRSLNKPNHLRDEWRTPVKSWTFKQKCNVNKTERLEGIVFCTLITIWFPYQVKGWVTYHMGYTAFMIHKNRHNFSTLISGLAWETKWNIRHFPFEKSNRLGHYDC